MLVTDKFDPMTITDKNDPMLISDKTDPVLVTDKNVFGAEHALGSDNTFEVYNILTMYFRGTQYSRGYFGGMQYWYAT